VTLGPYVDARLQARYYGESEIGKSGNDEFDKTPWLVGGVLIGAAEIEG